MIELHKLIFGRQPAPGRAAATIDLVFQHSLQLAVKRLVLLSCTPGVLMAVPLSIISYLNNTAFKPIDLIIPKYHLKCKSYLNITAP